jgi:hypothetical protein
MDLSNDSLDEDNADDLNSRREPQPWLFETLIDLLEKEMVAEPE